MKELFRAIDESQEWAHAAKKVRVWEKNGESSAIGGQTWGWWAQTSCDSLTFEELSGKGAIAGSHSLENRDTRS